MLCPHCRAAYATDDLYCRSCGADLSKPSKSLVPVRKHLPAPFAKLHLPRVAAGVGIIAASAGLELLRRGLLARMAKSARPAARAVPALSGLQELFVPDGDKKLPKGYEIHETLIYRHRVIRRER